MEKFVHSHQQSVIHQIIVNIKMTSYNLHDFNKLEKKFFSVLSFFLLDYYGTYPIKTTVLEVRQTIRRAIIIQK